MDAFSKGMERWKEASNLLKKIPMQMEFKRLKKYEAEVFNDFDHHIIISEQDRNHIDHPKKEKIHIIPNGVDYHYFKPVGKEKKYDLLFAGNMNYPPNVESALFIVNEILPLVRKQKPGITLLIAGANPSLKIRNLEGNGIHVSGWMDDIREAFASSYIHLAPMLISIGLQNKILQAMAMKIPSVISALANNAIHAPGNCVLVASTPEEYAEKIIFLLQNKTEADALAENAYGFVRENFDWGKEIAKIEKIFVASPRQSLR
jgi:glycosyltransferase involved in cell wall biosynthesis